MLILVGMVLIQTSGANAQFGGLGNLINKKLNDLNKLPNSESTNLPSTDQSKTISDGAAANAANNSWTINSAKKKGAADADASSLNLPPIFDAARLGDEAQFTEQLKKDMSTVNKTLAQVSGSRFGYGNEKRDDDGHIIPDPAEKFRDYTLLAFAAENGSTNIIQQLLDLEVNVKEPSKIYPLSLAARNGHVEAVKMLLKAQAILDDGFVAAYTNGHMDVVKVLIDAGHGVSLKTAIQLGDLEIVKISLKQHPRHWDGSQTDDYPSKWDGYVQRKVFRYAIAKGNLDIVKAFVSEGEDVSDDRDEYDRERNNETLVQIAIKSNHPEIVAYLKEAKKTQVDAIAEKEVAKGKNEAENLAVKEKEKAAENEALQKKIVASLDHPTDIFGMSKSRYRKFNGTVYDCAEPIEFLNRYFTFLPIEAQYNDNPNSLKEIKDRIEAESKWLQANPWFKIRNDCYIEPVLVNQVTPDGLIVRLNSQQNEVILVLLKNHPKQKTAVDGEAIIEPMRVLFAVKTSPYQYVGALGASQTILAYDMGVTVPTPPSSVPKIPLPDTN